VNADKLIRGDLIDLPSYEPPDLQAVASEAGLPVQQLVRLDSNENPYGPSPQVARALADCAVYQYYPDYREVRQALADYSSVEPNHVVLGNGADELIDLLIRAFVRRDEAVVLCPPAFSMYNFFALLNGCPVRKVPRDSNFSIDTSALSELVRRTDLHEQARLLFLTSPGNPDGQLIPMDTIESILRLPLLVVVDEAYVEFGGHSSVSLLGDHPNLVIVKTLSKWAGLAGLRLGYVLASSSIVAVLEQIRAPYNVNTAALVATLATLGDLDYLRANTERLIHQRQRMFEAVGSMSWVTPIPSQANFLLCRLWLGSGQQLAEALLSRGILIRSFSDNRLRNYVRFSIGLPEQNQSLLEALADYGAERET